MTLTPVKESTKRIRKVIKKWAPNISIRVGSGTARGWIDISGSEDKYGNFTDNEKIVLGYFGISHGENFANISPKERENYLGKIEDLGKRAMERHELDIALNPWPLRSE